MKLRIRELRKARSWTLEHLAEAAGVSRGYLNQIELGTRVANTRRLEQIARALGVRPAELIEGPRADAEPSPPDLTVIPSAEPDGDGAALVPVYEVEVGAGPGREPVAEEAVATLAFPPDYLGRIAQGSRAGDLAVLRVRGDSMEPTIPDDSVVLIDRAKRDLSWDGIFVLRDGGDGLLVKRIGRAGKRGWVQVISDNRGYPAVERSVAELDVIGRVLWYGRKV